MIGARLRELRTARQLSLRQLATSAGVSATLLSQIERGVTEPSLETLRRLATVFGESIATLFVDPAAPVVRVSGPGEREILPAREGGIRYERLTAGDGKLEVLRGLLRPGQTSAEEPIAHASTECAYVVAGTLLAEVGGTRYDVAAGESITFDATLPHLYRNDTGTDVEIIVSVTPPIP